MVACYDVNDIEILVSNIMHDPKRVVLVAGPSASWKTFIAHLIADKLRKQWMSVLEVSSDNYYRDDTRLHAMVYGSYDHPHLIRSNKLVEDIDVYFRTWTVHLPVYSFVEKKVVAYQEVVEQYDIVLIEWLYTISLYAEKFDAHSIYVSSPVTELIMRRMIRDIERVKEPAWMIVGHLDNVFPLWNVFGRNQLQWAEFVIENSYDILLSAWHVFEYDTFSGNIPHWFTKRYCLEHIYRDKDEGYYPDMMIVTERYDPDDIGLLKQVSIKNITVDRQEKKWRLLEYTFSHPGIFVQVHSLFQLSGLQLRSTTKLYKYVQTDKQTSLPKKIILEYQTGEKELVTLLENT